MIDSSTIERDDSSALLPGMFRLAVTAPGEDEPSVKVVHGSSVVVGRSPGCKCRLEHPDVSRRHAYLQAIYGRIYCIDLASRTGTFWGESARRGGWLDPDGTIRVGPFQLQFLDAIGIGTGSEQLPDDFNPLAAYAGQLGPLPKIKLQLLSGAASQFDPKITRLITLVGSSQRCAFRVQDDRIAPVHCSLLWVRDGLWVVDLAGKGATRVGGKSARCTRVEHGQKIRVGPLVLRVLYPGGEGPVAGYLQATDATAEGDMPVLPAAEEAEGAAELDVDRLRIELEKERALVAVERAEVHAMRQSLDAQRRSIEARLKQLDPKATKLSEAQERLAAEWERLHAERAAAAAAAEEAVLQQQQALAEQSRQLVELRKRARAEWKKLQLARSRVTDAQERLGHDRAELAQRQAELERRSLDSQSETPPQEIETLEPRRKAPVGPPDLLDATFHNNVFRTERDGTTLIVTPLGDASGFHYDIVHVESNKVRRLLDHGEFRDLIVDLGSASVSSTVMIKAIVAFSRIVTNRGGRAVLCSLPDVTRGVLQSMKLLDIWPLFDGRHDALGIMRRHGDG